MDMSSHLDQLREKHEVLDEEIKAVERRPGADHLEIALLKKRKLKLKEQITRIVDTSH